MSTTGSRRFDRLFRSEETVNFGPAPTTKTTHRILEKEMQENTDSKLNKAQQRLIEQGKKALAETVAGEYVECRIGAAGHSWVRVQPDFNWPGADVQAMAMQCDRCLAVKRYVVHTRYGVIIDGPRYEYPDGYKVKRNDGVRITPWAVRAVYAEQKPDHEMVEVPHYGEDPGS